MSHFLSNTGLIALISALLKFAVVVCGGDPALGETIDVVTVIAIEQASQRPVCRPEPDGHDRS